MHMFGFKRENKPLVTDVAGISFRNPLGITLSPEKTRDIAPGFFKAGFLSLTPPSNQVLEWISILREIRRKTVLAVNLTRDIPRSFSLVYDFADIIILDPDHENGIDSPSFSDISDLLDEVVSIRHCYEKYTPVFLRLSQGLTPEELPPMLSKGRLSGMDGVAVATLPHLKLTLSETQNRLPVICKAASAPLAAEAIKAGASLLEAEIRPLQIHSFLKNLEKQ